MRWEAAVTLAFADTETARAVLEATAVDNPKRGLTQAVRGRRVVLRASPSSARSLRATLDDWLRCASAAAEAAHRAR